MRTEIMKKVKRIVVKIGSSSLTNDAGLIHIRRIESLVKQLSDLHYKGYEIILVSSGAVAAGMGKLNLTTRPKDIPLLQSAAAVGQVALIHMYQKFFSEYGIVIAQLLLTRDGLDDTDRCFHTINASRSLLEHQVIQIVNENDAVAIDEITFGDNDTLSAKVAKLVDADLLIILSDIDGLYDSNPNINPHSTMIDTVHHINDDIKKLASDAITSVGTGGMITKLTAAEMMLSINKMMVIADSSVDWVVHDILSGRNIGTLFYKEQS